jgi:hypothetical protein
MTPSEIRFSGTLYRVVEVIETGLTSVVYKTTEGPVVTQHPSGKSIRELERDVFSLERLNEIGAVPELLAVDRSARAILMSPCGEAISAMNTPHDGKRSLRC